MATDDVKQVTETAGANSAAVKVTRPSGEQVEVDARAPTTPDGTAPRKAHNLDTNAALAETRAFNPATHDDLPASQSGNPGAQCACGLHGALDAD